jgi:tetratricopeptide (TPR) repeat protein
VEEVLKFYDRFAEQNAANAGSPRLQLDAARVHRRTGEVHSWRGNADKATASFRRAAELLENLHRRNPADEAVRSELAQTYLDAPPDVFPEYERLLTRAMELTRDLPKPPRPNMAGSLLLKLGWAREKAGNRDGAEKAYRDAIPALAVPPGAGDGRSPVAAVEQTLARSALAGLLAGSDRLPEARRVLEEAVAELRPPPERPRPGPGGRHPWELVAATQNQLADVCDKLGDRAAADRARAAARDARENLRDGPFPGGKKDGGPRKP